MELNDLERRLWAAADALWANTGLSPAQFSGPVLGLIFLRYAERRFHEVETGLLRKGMAARVCSQSTESRDAICKRDQISC